MAICVDNTISVAMEIVEGSDPLLDAKHLRFYGYRFLSEVTECISVQYDAYNRAMTIVVRKTLDKSI